jgi:cell surface protein SprA
VKRFFKYSFGGALATTFLSFVWGTGPVTVHGPSRTYFTILEDSTKPGSDSLPYPFRDRRADKLTSPYDDSPFYLKDPANVQSKVDYDPSEKRYNINENIGKQFYRNPSYLTLDEFIKKEYSKSTSTYWRKKAAEDDGITQRKPLIPKLHVGGEVFDRIFGGNSVDIKPQGSAELVFGWNTNRNNNPNIPERQRKVSTFDFREKIQLNVIANIGDKLKLSTNYNTEATFDFENQMKLEYTGYEDEIIKKIEAGNVNLPLNSSLITGSQSLFGIKTQLQFGRLTVTSVFSQQKGKTSTIESSGGAQKTEFKISADQYEANKHYFLSQYFYNRYDSALADLPLVKSPVTITRVEVWVTNSTLSSDKDNRNIVAFSDLGEQVPYVSSIASNGGPVHPDNSSNRLYDILNTQYPQYRDFINSGNITIPDLVISRDFERVENARKLSPNDFTFNSRLGYITVNTPLRNDDVLAVAFEYTIGSQVFRVGELSMGGVEAPKALFLKLLKSKIINTRLPMWNLMMKNIYNINAYQVSSKDFRLDVLYLDNSIGSSINYIPEGGVKGIPLIRILNLDRLNMLQNPQPDGIFDFVEGVTINSSNGRIIFPVTQPFGRHLRSKLDPNVANKYVFDSLYTTTQVLARQVLTQNKFTLRGSYQSSSSSEISLNAVNVPQGSVVVTAGGQRLVEGVHYTVDYALGRVKITDEGILQSGVPVKVSTESNALFSVQTKSLMGSRFDYMVSKDLNLGATILNLTERPLTQKVNIGEEPISNTIWGLDGTYRTDSRFITKLVDKIPFIDTKEISDITMSAEYARLVPGNARAIGKGGTSYIDDFEGSKTPIDMRGPTTWTIASVPQGQPTLFPEGISSLNNDLRTGYNRAKLAWYNIDPIFTRSRSETPDHITPEQQSNPYVREVPEQELFPNKVPANNQTQNIVMFNLAFYPEERGPYNYDLAGAPGISSGMNDRGNLNNPRSRWGGIMRRVEPTDFDASNIEFIEFWMMDPFANGTSEGGDLYFNLGNISEDVLRDSRKSAENALPTFNQASNLFTNTAWGKIPTIQAVSPAFDNDPQAREQQDVGLDGQGNAEERSFRKGFIDSVATFFGTSSAAYAKVSGDPSADDFHYFRGEDFDAQQTSILQRYKRINGQEGNSRTSGNTVTGTTIPDKEDVNNDNTLDLSESYFQYKVELKPGRMQVGSNYITNILETTYKPADGTADKPVKWYQFKVPIRKPEQIVGGIEDFRSIRYIRMFLKGFNDSIICRFARLQMVRGEWRRFTSDLVTPGEQLGDDDDFDNTVFDLTTINLEEDGLRPGIPYTIPPGITREVVTGGTTLQRLNEQSLLLNVCGLRDGDSRAAYKTTEFDIRNYKKLRMYIHAQKRTPEDILNPGDVTCFIRLGSDFTDNYYEVEIPLTPTPDGATSPDEIWPAINQLEVDLNNLQYLKTLRNNAMLQAGSTVKINIPFPAVPYQDGRNRITVKGVPNLSNVRTVMIGVRNPRQLTANGEDDGLEKCVEVWVNELRMTDFDQRGGWAANARMVTKLADFGTVNLSGSKSTPGWGGIEQKINERKREDVTQYDVSSSVELGRFLPEKTGVKIPMYIGYSQTKVVPLFNPLDPDIRLKDHLESIENKKIRDSIDNITTELRQTRSLNFTNVRKNKVGNAKPHFYDVENLTFTYAYTEAFQRSITVESNLMKTYRGAVGYNYNVIPKNIAPFAKLPVKSKYLRLLTDFNFYYSPSNVSFRTDVDRQYGINKLRPVSGGAVIDPNYNKIFNMNRFYDVKYDLTKSLKVDFNAINNSSIDEPFGEINTPEKRDSVKKNFLGGGRTTKYHHQVNVNYAVPINKLPLTDWINLSLRYTVDYDWASAPRFNTFGHTIQNSTNTQVNMPLNMTTLYNKIGYFQRLNQRINASKASSIAAARKPLKKDVVDTTKTKKDKKPDNSLSPFDYVARLLISLKSVSGSYTETRGTLLPGYNMYSHVLGQTFNAPSSPDPGAARTNAPGFGFILGQQRDVADSLHNIRFVAASKGWLVKDSTYSPFTQTYVSNLALRGNMELFPGFRIDLNASRNYSLNHQEYFRWTGGDNWDSFNEVQTGNFSVSFLSLPTSFRKDRNDYSSETFEEFRNYRFTIAERLARASEFYKGGLDSAFFPKGFGPNSQQVLIPAFIAAYSGSKPDRVKTDAFSTFPKPNWRITYDGLSRIPFFQKYFSSVTIGNGYRSSFGINSFTSNINYFNNPADTNQAGNFVSRHDIAQVSITEQFSPLASVDITWKNSLTTRAEMKRDRTASLSLSNNQVIEIRGVEYIIGLGYRLKEFKVPFKINKKQIALQNDLDFRVDLGYRLNNTIVRRLAENTNQPSAGSSMITIKASADYIVNERFNVRFYYDKVINTPVVSTSYPTSTTSAGVSIRFTLAQ